MAIEVEHFLVAIGVLVLAGFLAHLGFKKWRLPDVLILVGLGVLLGPVWHFVDVDVFRSISPLIGTVAIMMILFDGGLEMNLKELKHGAAKGTGLGVIVFVTTVILCAGVGYFVADLPAMESILLGMAFGGAGAVVVLPLIQQMGVRNESFTIVALEAAVSDVLVIVGVFALSEAMTRGHTEPAELAKDLFVTFALAIVVGLAAGLVWSRVLGKPSVQNHAYVLTLAVLLLLYIGCEHIEASGPIAVLAFGVVIGNSRKANEFVVRTSHGTKKVKTDHEGSAVFGDNLASFHHEAVFFIRNFFFFGLGVVLDPHVFQEPRFLLVGFLIAVCVAFGRYWGVMVLFKRKNFPAWDRTAIALMFPLGLAAAALSQVPARFGIAGTENFAGYAAVAIVLTNLFCSIGVFWVSRPSVRDRIDTDARGPAMATAQVEAKRGKTRNPVRAPPRAPPGAPPS